MNSVYSRPYLEPADLQRMVELSQSLRCKGQLIYPIAADLHEELADPDVQLTARVWENDRQQLVGFVDVNRC